MSVTQSRDSEGGRGKAVPREEKGKYFCITNILISVQGRMSIHILSHGYQNPDSSESREVRAVMSHSVDLYG